MHQQNRILSVQCHELSDKIVHEDFFVAHFTRAQVSMCGTQLGIVRFWWAVCACTVTPRSDTPHASPRVGRFLLLAHSRSITSLIQIQVSKVSYFLHGRGRTTVESLVNTCKVPVFAFHLDNQSSRRRVNCWWCQQRALHESPRVHELGEHQLLVLLCAALSSLGQLWRIRLRHHRF